MAEERPENQTQAAPQPANEEQKPITALELAKHVVNTTSAVLGALDTICDDAEKMRTARELLAELQRMAIEYTFNAAERAQKRSTWRRGGYKSRGWKR